MIFFGIFFATVAAFGLPLNVIIYGEYTTLLVDRTVKIYASTPTLVMWIFGGGRILYENFTRKTFKVQTPLLTNYFINRKNASAEENRLATIEDAQAFGLAGVTITMVQFITCIIAVDLLNYSAMKQVETTLHSSSSI